uniref:Uncharacterized protein n=1 Tax=Auxenochlorella protothecoides TaxID=3075 RepID=A0A1D2AF22_AUXPR
MASSAREWGHRPWHAMPWPSVAAPGRTSSGPGSTRRHRWRWRRGRTTGASWTAPPALRGSRRATPASWPPPRWRGRWRGERCSPWTQASSPRDLNSPPGLSLVVPSTGAARLPGRRPRRPHGQGDPYRVAWRPRSPGPLEGADPAAPPQLVARAAPRPRPRPEGLRCWSPRRRPGGPGVPPPSLADAGRGGPGLRAGVLVPQASGGPARERGGCLGPGAGSAPGSRGGAGGNRGGACLLAPEAHARRNSAGAALPPRPLRRTRRAACQPRPVGGAAGGRPDRRPPRAGHSQAGAHRHARALQAAQATATG